ncbi:transglycosylase SLT domain-containing protein, partial [candidate division KSB1 bacterium]|nr:transglycosylase SLT domain-containing protein [candidate division KSB1 bacterium]
MMKRFNPTSKPIIFVAGVLLGALVTLFGTQLPWDELFTRTDTDAASVEPAIDPLKDFDLPLNDRVESRIRYYTRPGAKVDLLASYRRSGQYLPMIKNIFEEYNLPQALVFLPILESGFSPDRTSRAGAVGLWQIMPSTASDYGLKYNRWIDERRDPEKSTIVAAEFLRFLYDQLANWDLALAAYNMGYSNLKRAMRRERTANYWDLKRIPAETYNFVPSFYAILNLLADPEKHGLDLPEHATSFEYETIELEATFTIEEIARLANVSPHVIKEYNPALISTIAPSGPYAVRVPVGVKDQFLEQARTNPPQQVEVTYMTYRIRRGDTLYKIAQRFGTTVRAIMADNNIRSARRMKAGQLLRLAVVTISEETSVATGAGDKSGSATVPDEANRIKFVYTVER